MSKRPRPLIGYLAAASTTELLCDGDACIIAGSEVKLKAYLALSAPTSANHYTLHKVRWEAVLAGLRAGGAYAFDEDAYQRFYPLAQRAGLAVGPEGFSTRPPAGLTRPALHLGRVQWR